MINMIFVMTEICIVGYVKLEERHTTQSEVRKPSWIYSRRIYWVKIRQIDIIITIKIKEKLEGISQRWKGGEWEHDILEERQVVWGLRYQGWGMEWDEVGKCPIMKVTVTKIKNVNFTLKALGIHCKIKCIV